AWSGCDTPRRMRTRYQSRNILDECLLSSSKRSAECIRAHRLLQAMKARDPLLAAWHKTVSRKGDGAAVFDSTGTITRSFRQIEDGARGFEATLEALPAGAVVAVQIGNHEDWPSLFIACLRKQLIVLPLDQSINEQQRDAALEICGAVATITCGADSDSPILTPREPLLPGGQKVSMSGVSLLKVTSGTTAAPRAIRFRSHQLLADCNQI